MEKTLEVTLKLFGALRSYSKEGVVKFLLASPCSIEHLKEALAEFLKSDSPKELREIISKSAIGNETEILQEDTLLYKSTQLAILPPVCGG
ncbi:MAG: hypothetical protein WCJ92_06760 [Alphaproteobacteria bacterium]